MYRYAVMFFATAVVFVIVFFVLDMVFGSPVSWSRLLFEGTAFGLVMTGVQYYKERNSNKN